MLIDLALLKISLPQWYEPTLYDQVQIVAQTHKLEPELVAAFISVESSFNPFAVKYEKNFKYTRIDYKDLARMARVDEEAELNFERMSLGIMQVMGATVRDMGYRGNLSNMFNVQTGLHWGCTYLSKLMTRHTNLESVISAYNAGTPRKIGGRFTNQDYVDKVMIKYKELKQKNVVP